MTKNHDQHKHGRITAEFNFSVGQFVEYAAIQDQYGNPVISEVIGVDRYSMLCRDGIVREWTSYTLRAADEVEGSHWNRWWAVNVPEICPHFYRMAKPDEMKPSQAPDDKLSGKVSIESDGDASWSTSEGLLETHRTEGGVYAHEVFLDANGEKARELFFIGLAKN